MKIGRQFKLILYITLGALFASGVATWALGLWFQIDRGLGPEPRPFRATALHAHGIAGLAFLMAFGYLIHSHIRPGLRGGRRKRSGFALLGALVALIATVPVLYYASDEAWKEAAAFIHTYLGLAAALPFAAHLARRAARN